MRAVLRLLPCLLLGLLLGACASLPPAPMKTPSVALSGSPDLQLARLAAGAPTADVSGFHLMPTGQRALQTRLELLRRAQQSLDVQSYHIADDETGRSVLRLLRDAAARGVRVRLLLDDLYTAGHDEMLLGLAAHPNVELRLFNPFPAGRGSLGGRFAASLFDFGRVHRRMHNKLLVADGTMAIVGGRNIADDYFMRQPGRNFIDLDTLVVGAVLPGLSALFDSYWNSRHAWPIAAIASSALAPGDLRAHFDRLTAVERAPLPEPRAGPDRFGALPAFELLDAGLPLWTWARAEAYADDPDKILGTSSAPHAAAAAERQGIRHRLGERIGGARCEVQVASPYVVPTRRSLELIGQLRARGVRMTLLTNSLAATDEPVVHAGYERHRDNLLRQGVELHELAPMVVTDDVRLTRLGAVVGRLHAKVAVIDRETLFLGSFNLDHRSATHNTELGLFITSRPLAEQALYVLDELKREGAYRLQLAPDGRSIRWTVRNADGSEAARAEPKADWWHRLLLEMLAWFVPEDLL